jgi:hypothetical protein
MLRHAYAFGLKPIRPKIMEASMRLFVLAVLTVTAFVATMSVNATDANAVVCAKGVVRAGCVAAGGGGAAVVAPRPVAPPVVYCKTVGVPKGCVMRR